MANFLIFLGAFKKVFILEKFKLNKNLELDLLKQNGFINYFPIFRLTMNNLGEPVTEAEVRSMILEADLDGDGKINFSEFKMLMAATKLNGV